MAPFQTSLNIGGYSDEEGIPTSSHLLNIDNMTWRATASLPYPLQAMSYSSYRDSVLLAGGNNAVLPSLHLLIFNYLLCCRQSLIVERLKFFFSRLRWFPPKKGPPSVWPRVWDMDHQARCPGHGKKCTCSIRHAKRYLRLVIVDWIQQKGSNPYLFEIKNTFGSLKDLLSACPCSPSRSYIWKKKTRILWHVPLRVGKAFLVQTRDLRVLSLSRRVKLFVKLNSSSTRKKL